MEKHPLHMKIPELQTSEEVSDAVEKQERLTDESIPNDPNERIDAYMDRLENIFLNEDKHTRERNLEMLRPAIYDAFIIKKENVPESYFELQQRVARERGQPVETIPEEMKSQMIDTIIEDQKASLDSWIDYLTSEDAVYPTWFKYFAFRNIVHLSQFDKKLGKFKTRTDSTTAIFPDIYREPLAQICDLYERVKEDNREIKDPEVQSIFSRKFPTVYAELIQKSLASRIENKEEIKGSWIKYEQGNTEDAKRLYKSLENKGTGWCTAGMSTAKAQIESGDFYAYYTEVDGDATQPRIAIRMNGKNQIGEVRGILPHQNLETEMQDILDEKLSEFGPEAEQYKKKTTDMKLLTELEKKTNENQILTKEELLFLYEVDSKIEGFGYEKDPRIEELRNKRNIKEDLPIIFECEANQIANTENEINKETKVYIGPLFNGIFKKNIEHIGTSFPERMIQKVEVVHNREIISAETAIAKLEKEGHMVGDYSKDMLSKVNWEEKLKSSYEIISLSVDSLFDDKNSHRYGDIKRKADELGLELVPASLAPDVRLNYPKGGDWTNIAMEAIRDRDGYLRLFYCYRLDSESWLGYNYGRDDRGWDDSDRFFFVRK